jgi:hypothetical protein
MQATNIAPPPRRRRPKLLVQNHQTSFYAATAEFPEFQNLESSDKLFKPPQPVSSP